MAIAKTPPPEQPNIGRLPELKISKKPGFRRTPWRKTGPKNLHLSRLPELVSGPGLMPEAFKSGKTSQSEWVLYWAMCKVHGTPEDPRVGPFEGDHGSPPKWSYQKYLPILGVTGKTNVDFIAYLGPKMIGIRLESERFHMEADPIQKALDEWLMTHNFNVHQIVNIYEQDYMADMTGNAACIVMANASKGIGSQGPLKLGNYWRVR
jgi:hypothetical protein